MVEKDIGFVGEVTKVDSRLVQTLVDDGTIPVLATVAASPTGESLNVNADIAAGEVCNRPRPCSFSKFCRQPMRQ